MMRPPESPPVGSTADEAAPVAKLADRVPYAFIESAAKSMFAVAAIA